MKKHIFLLGLIVVFVSCTSQKNSEDFINATSGRYLFNANEILEIYFEDAEMHAKWRGNDNVELLKINDSSFYMKALNEKMLFVSKPKMHIELAPKTEHKGVVYHFKKLKADEKTASEYFKAKEFDKALAAFKEIQAKDSLNASIRERSLNRLGYDFIRNKDYESALEIFKINTHLYPKSSNVFNSLGEAYLLKKDTASAVLNFKKSLSINPENRSSKHLLERLTKN
ncbi:tetratricopeptide repeat protein [Polaribacter sp.]|uniref:tetratricopeptide repeat protein n=1 Tax=Polaribacter sp. TaxID=1920175 RepID=UPI003F6CC35A